MKGFKSLNVYYKIDRRRYFEANIVSVLDFERSEEASGFIMIFIMNNLIQSAHVQFVFLFDFFDNR